MGLSYAFRLGWWKCQLRPWCYRESFGLRCAPPPASTQHQRPQLTFSFIQVFRCNLNPLLMSTPDVYGTSGEKYSCLTDHLSKRIIFATQAWTEDYTVYRLLVTCLTYSMGTIKFMGVTGSRFRMWVWICSVFRCLAVIA